MCESPCETCNNSSFCTSCLADHPYLHPDGSCHAPCPMGYYGDDATRTCVECHSSCRTCHGAESMHCDTCEVPLYLIDHTCVEECPEDRFEADYCVCSDNNDCGCCKHCHTSCESCHEGTDMDCVVCAEGFYAQPDSSVHCM
jgi:proprotein convertase subtilisin/kexin type 5